MQTFLPFSDFSRCAAWRGYSTVLAVYGMVMCYEWTSRGYCDSCAGKIAKELFNHEVGTIPPWLGNEALHSAYRGLLIHKMPEHYRDTLGWNDEPIERIDYSLFQETQHDPAR